MKQSETEIKEAIAKTFGFKKELIKNASLCGLWHVRFEVNDIRFYGWIPYHGAVPQISVEGYNTKYYWHGTPVTEAYYKELIEGKTIRLYRYNATKDDWEWMDKTFTSPKEAEEYIRGMESPEKYNYDIWEESNV